MPTTESCSHCGAALEHACTCGRRFATRQGVRVHQRTCAVERARSDAFVKAIKDGLRGEAVRRAETAAVTAALAAQR
jgi:hypothetical protein